MLQIARLANNFDPKMQSSPVHLHVDGCNVGIVPRETLNLPRTDSVFVLDQSESRLEFNPILNAETRTVALENILLEWKRMGVVCLQGWRNERFAVYGLQSNVLFEIERAGVGLFGLRSYGVHVNGITNNKMWVSRRSSTKTTYPCMLDQISGGGLSQGTPVQCAVRECWEEASIPLSLTAHLEHVGEVRFWHCKSGQYVATTEYVYDLEIPSSFVPTPNDSEVCEFHLLTIDEVRGCLLNKEFTPSASAVVIDYLIRHGCVEASECEAEIRVDFGFPGPNFSEL